jgi:hypothetical protein
MQTKTAARCASLLLLGVLLTSCIGPGLEPPGGERGSSGDRPAPVGPAVDASAPDGFGNSGGETMSPDPTETPGGGTNSPEPQTPPPTSPPNEMDDDADAGTDTGDDSP